MKLNILQNKYIDLGISILSIVIVAIFFFYLTLALSILNITLISSVARALGIQLSFVISMGFGAGLPIVFSAVVFSLYVRSIEKIRHVDSKNRKITGSVAVLCFGIAFFIYAGDWSTNFLKMIFNGQNFFVAITEAIVIYWSFAVGVLLILKRHTLFNRKSKNEN